MKMAGKAKIFGTPSDPIIEGDFSVVSYRVEQENVVRVVQVALPTALIDAYDQRPKGLGATAAAAVVSRGRSVVENAIAGGEVPRRISVKAPSLSQR
jgi:hypothetical protein